MCGVVRAGSCSVCYQCSMDRPAYTLLALSAWCGVQRSGTMDCPVGAWVAVQCKICSFG